MRFWLGTIGLLACEVAFGGNVILPSDVSVSLQAEPSTDLQPGQPIRLTITVTNNGPVVLNDLGLESANAYPDQIDQTHPDTDCGDMVRSVTDGATTYWYNLTWYPTDSSPLTPRDSPLGVGESRSCHVTISLVPSAPQTVPFDFHLNPYWSDPNPTNDVGRVTLQRAAAIVAPIPVGSPESLTSIAILLLLLGLAALGPRISTRARTC